MNDRYTTRSFRCQGIALLCLMACVGSPVAIASSGKHGARPQQAAPIERKPPPSEAVPGATYAETPSAQIAPIQRREDPRGPKGEHLAEWMSQHSNLTPEEQQRALEHEPGFHELPAETQKRMRTRLAELDAMTPQQRQRLLARNEAMERLTPNQRAEVRGALGQLGSLPLDQRRAVARTFRALRDLPPEQRIPALNSGRFGSPFNDMQRATLNNLLRVEPMLPAPTPATTQPQPSTVSPYQIPH